MKRDDVVNYLQILPDEEMVAVLESVFKGRVPWPEESEFCDNRYCLGVAFRNKCADSDDWEPFSVEVVAYVDRNEYNGTEGPGYGLCQSGTCGCGLDVRSNVKRGFCPACSASVYMT